MSASSLQNLPLSCGVCHVPLWTLGASSLPISMEFCRYQSQVDDANHDQDIDPFEIYLCYSCSKTAFQILRKTKSVPTISSDLDASREIVSKLQGRLEEVQTAIDSAQSSASGYILKSNERRRSLSVMDVDESLPPTRVLETLGIQLAGQPLSVTRLRQSLDSNDFHIGRPIEPMGHPLPGNPYAPLSIGGLAFDLAPKTRQQRLQSDGALSLLLHLLLQTWRKWCRCEKMSMSHRIPCPVDPITSAKVKLQVSLGDACVIHEPLSWTSDRRSSNPKHSMMGGSLNPPLDEDICDDYDQRYEEYDQDEMKRFYFKVPDDPRYPDASFPRLHTSLDDSTRSGPLQSLWTSVTEVFGPQRLSGSHRDTTPAPINVRDQSNLGYSYNEVTRDSDINGRDLNPNHRLESDDKSECIKVGSMYIPQERYPSPDPDEFETALRGVLLHYKALETSVLSVPTSPGLAQSPLSMTSPPFVISLNPLGKSFQVETCRSDGVISQIDLRYWSQAPERTSALFGFVVSNVKWLSATVDGLVNLYRASKP